MKTFDLVVIGGGHAGIEASVAAARMGCSVALVTSDASTIGRMSCNPAIGGTAKGHLVHEIDALGGVMGEIADETGIQFRTLNRSKGPAIWSSRCQSDRDGYARKAQEIIRKENQITTVEDTVLDMIFSSGKVTGIVTEKGEHILCMALIVASGTFLNGILYTGLKGKTGGRLGEKAVTGLSETFQNLGIKTGRLKTGTPPRLLKNSIDYDVMNKQEGDSCPVPFSRRTDKSNFPTLPQVDCHITFTNQKTHEVLSDGFEQSPIFTGVVSGVGPRYCPSIEDKVIRFADRQRHQLFIEPDGLKSPLVYLNGFSTSLPEEIQLSALRTVQGLEQVQIVRYGYAVEYDFFPAYQVYSTLESKFLQGLYFAGQVNGTSGYEEAAAQGLMAGINAAAKLQASANNLQKNFVLRRDEAYIGVLIDDLVTKPSDEPYRIFTSRAEHRLLLRQDNAHFRLSNYGFQLGLINDSQFDQVSRQKKMLSDALLILRSKKIRPEQINTWLVQQGEVAIKAPEKISALSCRSRISLASLLNFLYTSDDKDLFQEIKKGLSLHTIRNILNESEILQLAEIELKYEGYIKRDQKNIERLKRLESLIIPEDFNFEKISSVSNEGREKLELMKPSTLGQASRISGVSPSDISVLLVHLRDRRNKRRVS